MRRSGWIAAALAAAALLASCGGDADNSGSTDSAKPELTVPGETTGTDASTDSTDTTTESTDTTPSEGGATTGPMDQPNPDNGGVPAPDGNNPPADQPPPDSPSNDTPPKPGSPADRFEQFCAQNPGAC